MQIYLRFYMFFFSFYFLGNAKTPQQCVEVNRVPFIKMNILFLTVTGFWQPPKCVSMQSISSCSLYGISICSHLPIFLHRNTLTLQHLSKLFNAARRTTVEEAISWWLMLKSRWGVAVDVGFLLVGLCWLSVTCVWWNHEYLVISRTWKNSVKSRHHYLGHESKQKKKLRGSGGDLLSSWHCQPPSQGVLVDSHLEVPHHVDTLNGWQVWLSPRHQGWLGEILHPKKHSETTV